MNNYKVGDRVWYSGRKWIVFSVIKTRVHLYSDIGVLNIPYYRDDIKPILKVKNGVICENN